MVKLLKIVALTTALAAASTSYATPQAFSYSYTYETGGSLAGTFVGNEAGDLITDLTDITASLDGVTYNSSGSLYAASYSPNGGWQTGGAVVSISGAANDFIFIDSNFPTDGNYTNYAYLVPDAWGIAQGPGGLEANDTVWGTNSSWTVKALTAAPIGGPSVPAPFSAGLLGLGLAAALLRQRRSVLESKAAA